MMTAKVYGIPNCSSVKKALANLKQQNVEIHFHDFKKQGASAELLGAWVEHFGAEKVLNRKGTTWRGLDEAQQAKAETREGAISLMQEFPSLIKRPVVDFAGALSIGQTEFTELKKG